MIEIPMIANVFTALLLGIHVFFLAVLFKTWLRQRVALKLKERIDDH